MGKADPRNFVKSRERQWLRRGQQLSDRETGDAEEDRHSKREEAHG